MHITFQKPGFSYMINTILEFQKEDMTSFWSEPLYYFYPSLNKEYAASLSFEDKKAYITQTLQKEYEEKENLLDEKIYLYQAHWDKHKEQVTEALSEAFEIDCSAILNDMVCNISLNPIQPRFLKNHSFDVFYLNSERGALGTALHEMIHFVWFYMWNSIYRDSYEEYETPSLKWILSEMVVETIMRDERLSSVNPYFPRENGGCIYPYFFTMMVEEKCILDTIDELYSNNGMKDFMERSYQYCLAHEKAIREHIAESEKNGN